MKTKRRGGSGIVPVLLLIVLVVVFYKWPSFIDSSGVEATAHVTEKREGIRIPFDDWFRQYEIVAGFRVPGDGMEHHAACDVEQEAYDSLHVGNPVTVHYWTTLVRMNQPFIPATHLSPCTARANFGSNPAVYRKLELVLGSLLAIAFVTFVLRIRIAVWLLLPWFYFFLVTAVVPHEEPAPKEPKTAQASVRSIIKITRIMENSDTAIESRGNSRLRPIELQHPFQIVELEFTPAGKSDAVVAIDAIDADSIPNLQKNQSVDINYDLGDPRIARLRGGTRNFPAQAKQQVLTIFGVIGAIGIIVVSVAAKFARN